MGSRGIWRLLEAYPSIFAAAVNVAGGPESAKSTYISEQYATATDGKNLDSLSGIMFHMYASYADQTNGYQTLQTANTYLQSIGAKSEITMYSDQSHSQMAFTPFTENLIEFLTAAENGTFTSSASATSNVIVGISAMAASVILLA